MIRKPFLLQDLSVVGYFPFFSRVTRIRIIITQAMAMMIPRTIWGKLFFEDAEQLIQARLFEFRDRIEFACIEPNPFTSRAFVHFDIFIIDFNQFHSAFGAPHIMELP